MAKGDPCKHCGKPVNRHAGMVCSACAARARRAANPEKAKARQKAWLLAHREEQSARQKARRLANPEKQRARVRAWQLANRERVAAGHRERLAAETLGVTLAQYRRMITDPNYHPDDDNEDKDK